MTTLSHTYQKAAAHLTRVDPFLAPVIARTGLCKISPHTEYYRELVESIISQQLSVKAASTILQRFVALFGAFPTPEQILTKEIDELRSAGLSRAKAVYVQDLARHVLGGSLQIAKLPHLSNEEIVRELTTVKGIGEWTAHMFLMFSLGRLDILPVGDLGIRNGIMKLYRLPALPDAAQVRATAQKYQWHPYESIACWYIWQSLDNAPAMVETIQN